MAKIPNVPVKFTADINRPSLGGAAFVKPATQPNEALLAGKDFNNKLLGQLGAAALDLNVAKQQVDLEEKQEETIQEYMDRRQENQDRLALEAADLDKTATEMLYGGARPEEIHPVLQEFQQRFDKLQKAREQGIMSPMELSTKILANTREAVAKFPGLYKELLQHSEKVLELSGIKSVVELDQANIKAQQEEQSKWRSEVRQLTRSLNIPFNYINPSQSDYIRANEAISQLQMSVQSSETLDRATKAEDIVTKQQAKDWITTEAPLFITGDVTRLMNSFIATVPDNPKEYDQWVFQLRDAAEGAKDRLISVANRKGISGDPRVQEAVKEHQRSLDAFVSRMEKLQSGEDAAEIMKHMHNRIADTQRYNLAQKFDIAAINALGMLPDRIYANHAVKYNIEGLTSMLDGLINNATGGKAFLRGLTEDTINAGTNDVVSTMFGLLDNGAKPTFEQGLATLVDSVIDNPKFETEAQQKQFLSDFVNELAKPSRKGLITNSSPQAIEDASQLIDAYVNKAALWKDRAIKDYEARGIFIRAARLPDGSIKFESNDPAAARDMNKNFAGPLNKGLAALGNMLNMGTKEASDLAATRYRQQIFGATNRDTGAASLPITPMPNKERVVMRTRQDVEAAVKAGRISKEDAEIVLTQMEADEIEPTLPER